MFRCDNCGSGYSTQAATSWTSCPRCLAKEKIQVPLTFELGWQRRQVPAEDDRLAAQARGSRRATAKIVEEFAEGVHEGQREKSNVS